MVCIPTPRITATGLHLLARLIERGRFHPHNAPAWLVPTIERLAGDPDTPVDMVIGVADVVGAMEQYDLRASARATARAGAR